MAVTATGAAGSSTAGSAAADCRSNLHSEARERRHSRPLLVRNSVVLIKGLNEK